MMFDNQILYDHVQKKNNILVKTDDQYNFYDEPDFISLGFMIAVTVEACLSAEDADAYMINGETFNEALFRFSYSYNEGDEKHFELKIKKEHIELFTETYLFVKTGSDVCEASLLEQIKDSCRYNCMNIWNEYFKNN